MMGYLHTHRSDVVFDRVAPVVSIGSPTVSCFLLFSGHKWTRGNNILWLTARRSIMAHRPCLPPTPPPHPGYLNYGSRI